MFVGVCRIYGYKALAHSFLNNKTKIITSTNHWYNYDKKKRDKEILLTMNNLNITRSFSSF